MKKITLKSININTYIFYSIDFDKKQINYIFEFVNYQLNRLYGEFTYEGF